MGISRYHKIFGVGPLGFSYGLLLFAFLYLLNRTWNHTQLADRAWIPELAGLFLIGIWTFWHAWCIRTIRAWWQKDCLCTSGPFRLVRHPMYFGGIFGAGLGASLLFNSWILLLWPFLIYPLWSLLVRREEKTMAYFFGKEYERYAARTGRLFPKVFK